MRERGTTYDRETLCKQFRFNDWEKWGTYAKQYQTLEEAKAALQQKKGFPTKLRIAESYTVIRYKAVKE